MDARLKRCFNLSFWVHSLTTRAITQNELKRPLGVNEINKTQKTVKTWKSRRISVHGTQGTIFENIFLSSLICMRVMGNYQERQEKNKNIDTFELWCAGRLLRVSWKDKKVNEWVLKNISSDVMLQNIIESKKVGILWAYIEKNINLARNDRR